MLTLSASSVKGSTVIGNLPLLFMINQGAPVTVKTKTLYCSGVVVTVVVLSCAGDKTDCCLMPNLGLIRTQDTVDRMDTTSLHLLFLNCMEYADVTFADNDHHWCSQVQRPDTCMVSPSVKHADRTLYRVRGAMVAFYATLQTTTILLWV